MKRYYICDKCGKHFFPVESEGMYLKKVDDGNKYFVHRMHLCPHCGHANELSWLHWNDGRLQVNR